MLQKKDDVMAFLRMKQIYVDWTKEGKKLATTRAHPKELGIYELVNGQLFTSPNRTGVKIQIIERVSWKLCDVTKELKARIIKAENFGSWEEFVGILESINHKKANQYDQWFTHFFRVVA